MTQSRRILTFALLASASLFVAACDRGTATPQDHAAGVSTPARVAVVSVQPERVVVIDELPGRVAALRTAEIRPQVTGIVRKVLFREGSDVTAGQPLFEIDPAPFAADVDAARAVLARAKADLLNANLKHERVQALSAARTASAAAVGDATATLAQAKASVAEATASLTRRELELSYATVRSPIDGRIGQALTTEGGLVTVGGANPLAIVQQLDKVYLDVRQPSMRREMLEELRDSGLSEDAGTLPVEILTIAGKPYEFQGKVLFSESTVDPSTGSIAIRVEVPNTYGQLLPGMYLRAKVPRSVYAAALLVPQQAVRRDPTGHPQLTIIGTDGTATVRDVELGALVGRRYVVQSGLAAGETVIVEGQDRAAGGQPVQSVTYQPADTKSES